jgi:hypothetical protein
MADYGSGGWGFESLAARHHHRSSAALSQGRRLLSGRRTATKLRPRWRALPTRLRPPATTMAYTGSIAAGQRRRGGASQRSAVGAALSTSTSGPAHRSVRLLSVGGFEPADGLVAPPHAGVARAARTPASVALGRPNHGKDGVAGSIPAGGSTSKGNRHAWGIRHAWGMGASTRHRGLIRGHGRWVMVTRGTSRDRMSDL